nr:hypothetical protein [uncultured Ralstonia sp.]
MIFRTAQGQNRPQEAALDSGLLVQEERKPISFHPLRTEYPRPAAQQCISPIPQRSIGE